MKRSAATLAVTCLSGVLIAAMPGQRAGGGGAAGQAQARPAPDPRSRSGRECRDNPYNCIDTPNPLTPPDTVWLEELTWMDVRDVQRAGKTTILVPTGGIEPSGPWLTLGKHEVNSRVECEAIARKLGNALCAPIIQLVPEGNYDTKGGHMNTAGTITVREETFEAMLTDVAKSFKAGDFENIIFLGDSGGNQRGQKAVAAKLTAEWQGHPVIAHIPEFYDNESIEKYLVEIGVTKTDQKSDNIHDEPYYSFDMMVGDPQSVRWAARVKANKATIDGVSLADKAKAIALGKKLIDYHATNTVAAIKKAIANKGVTTVVKTAADEK